MALHALSDAIRISDENDGAAEDSLLSLLVNRSQAHRELGDTQAASLDLDRAQAEAARLDRQDELARIAAVHASILLELGRGRDATLMIEQSIEGAQRMGDFDSIIKRRWLFAVTLMRSGLVGEARQQIDLALPVLPMCESPRTRAEFLQVAANVASAQGISSDELRFLRRSWEEWETVVELPQEAGLRTVLASQAFDVARRLVVSLADAGDLEAAWNVWERSRAAGLRLKLGHLNAAPSVDAVRDWVIERSAHVRTGVALLIYSPNRLVSLVMDANGQLSFRQTPCEPDLLRQRIANYREALPSEDSADVPYALEGPIADLRDLTQPLLRDVWSSVDHLVMMPTFTFWICPWSALLGDPSGVRQVSLAPSCTWLIQQATAPCLLQSAPIVSIGVGVSEDELLAEECRALAAAFPVSELILEDEATKAAVITALEREVVVHVSVHGSWIPAEHGGGRLECADGQLGAAELAARRVRSPLVLFSACHSALMHVAPNDDALGLVPELLSIGAANVVGTLWAVSTTATTAFVLAFIGRIKKGARLLDAFQGAVDELRAANPDPQEWAAFQLFGVG